MMQLLPAKVILLCLILLVFFKSQSTVNDWQRQMEPVGAPVDCCCAGRKKMLVRIDNLREVDSQRPIIICPEAPVISWEGLESVPFIVSMVSRICGNLDYPDTDEDKKPLMLDGGLMA